MGAGARVFCSRIQMLQMLHICFRFNKYSLLKQYPRINLHANLNSSDNMYNCPFPHCGDLCLISVWDGADKLYLLLFPNVLAHFQGPTLSETKQIFCRTFWTFGICLHFYELLSESALPFKIWDLQCIPTTQTYASHVWFE